MDKIFSSYIKGMRDAAQQNKNVDRHSETYITLLLKEDASERERHSRRERKLLCFSGWTFLAGLCWGITPYLFNIAYIARNGSISIGSEAIVPLIPIICFLLHRAENKRTKK